MATFFDGNHKNKVGVAITRRMGEAVIKGELEGDQMPVVCRYVLAVIDTIKTNEELITFLSKLSLRWSCFQAVLTSEIEYIKTVESVEQKFSARARAH